MLNKEKVSKKQRIRADLKVGLIREQAATNEVKV